MPTYQYACTECGHHFEQFQSFNDDAVTHCPTCDGRVRKVFSAVGVVFKGSGFYHNDSRSGRPSETGSGDSGGSGGSESTSTEKKSETPAASTSSSDAGAAPATPRQAKREAKREAKRDTTAGAAGSSPGSVG